MCTLSWRAAANGYDLFFNRDELNTRLAEQPPTLSSTSGGMGYAAPVDGNHGGTWLLLNAAGTTVCLLNDYSEGGGRTGKLSRGRLPLACAECVRAADVPVVLRTIALGDFAPFQLMAVDAGGGAVQVSWDGQVLRETSALDFLTSSSFESNRVQAARAVEFAAWPDKTAEGLANFHRQHNPANGADSVLMQRSDAATRSVCSVRVRSGQRELRYEPIHWDGLAKLTPVVLHL